VWLLTAICKMHIPGVTHNNKSINNYKSKSIFYLKQLTSWIYNGINTACNGQRIILSMLCYHHRRNYIYMYTIILMMSVIPLIPGDYFKWNSFVAKKTAKKSNTYTNLNPMLKIGDHKFSVKWWNFSANDQSEKFITCQFFIIHNIYFNHKCYGSSNSIKGMYLQLW
jgi:hypothetical protein